MKNTPLHWLLAGMFSLLVFFGAKAYHQAILYEDATTELVSYQNAGQQASLQFEKFAKHLFGDLYEDEQKIKLDQIKEHQDKTMHQAKEYTVYFMLLSGVILLSFFLMSLREFIFWGSLVAMLMLILGLITPILMVTIHKEIEYLGDIVLSFESKGVIGSIVKLYESGDVIVAAVILLFSVFVPVVKVFLLLFISVFVENKFAHKAVMFFKMIGKWSMVDVFVVAVFLVYLTAGNADISRAEVEVGLYFFLAYVIVSMLVSLSADAMVSGKSRIQN
jgi:hypothetical protein